MAKEKKASWVWTYENGILVRNLIIGEIHLVDPNTNEKEVYYKLTGHPHELLRADQ